MSEAFAHLVKSRLDLLLRSVLWEFERFIMSLSPCGSGTTGGELAAGAAGRARQREAA